MSEDLFKEIDADIKAEKLRYLVRRHARWVVVVVIILLVAISLWQFWQWRQHRLVAKASASYAQIMQQIAPLVQKQQETDTKTAHQSIDQLRRFSAHAPQSVRALSQFKQAALLIDQGKVKEASLIWNAIRFDHTASSDFRSLANLLWVQNNLDSANQKELHNRIAELLAQKTPWYAMARECEGLLDLKNGRLIEAKQIFGQLSMDMNVSPGIKKRASMMLQIIANSKKG